VWYLVDCYLEVVTDPGPDTLVYWQLGVLPGAWSGSTSYLVWQTIGSGWESMVERQKEETEASDRTPPSSGDEMHLIAQCFLGGLVHVVIYLQHGVTAACHAGCA
jgi:hypothetical protein